MLEPFSSLNIDNYSNIAILAKVTGKCTTDHISPAGYWLRYRGHIDNISNNLLLGASNSFTDKIGTGINKLTNDIDKFAEIARSYKLNNISWLIIGDHNYGEGSSREHAALSPRLLGGTAVIARSFARIHESNLKKQGLLALTFSDPSEYDRIREDDRVNLIGLKEITPGKPVEVVVNHSDGTSETLYLNHTCSEPQLAWFRLGSALNLFHQ